jgi:CAAX protease family protein
VLQEALTAVLGRAGVLWSTLVFVVAYLGVRPAAYVVFIGAVGLAFAWLVERTGSLLGVAVAHGLLNVGLIVVWPAVLD